MFLEKQIEDTEHQMATDLQVRIWKVDLWIFQSKCLWWEKLPRHDYGKNSGREKVGEFGNIIRRDKEKNKKEKQREKIRVSAH